MRPTRRYQHTVDGRCGVHTSVHTYAINLFIVSSIFVNICSYCERFRWRKRLEMAFFCFVLKFDFYFLHWRQQNYTHAHSLAHTMRPMQCPTLFLFFVVLFFILFFFLISWRPFGNDKISFALWNRILQFAAFDFANSQLIEWKVRRNDVISFLKELINTIPTVFSSRRNEFDCYHSTSKYEHGLMVWQSAISTITD